MPGTSNINVLFMASEADPLIKVGGLGDVAGSLPRALRAVAGKSGESPALPDVRLVIPYHPLIRTDRYPTRLAAEYKVRSTSHEIPAKAYALNMDGLPVYLISGPPIDQETGVYSANLEADGYKYVFFSLAALELARNLGWRPDIIHANDWHTSAGVYSLALNRPSDPFFRSTSSLLTIHNLPYMGSMTSSALEAFDLPPATITSLPGWASHMVLPLGLLTADSIVAVSPGYAREILSEDFGAGLQIFLRARSEKISGILNGLDTCKWDPSADSEIAAKFSASSLDARSTNKSALQAELALDVNPQRPLFAMVTRMDPQKGVDLAVSALRSLLKSAPSKSPPFQSVILGTGDPVLEQAARQLELDFPGAVRSRIMYNEGLSRHIYAGADFLLIPSRYEPCGLSQMIAMRYGCIPIGRATGGLSDTILDPAQADMGTGFLFGPASAEALEDAIQRALSVYLHDPQAWNAMQIRAMQQDFSWDRSASQYLQKYEMLLNNRKYV